MNELNDNCLTKIFSLTATFADKRGEKFFDYKTLFRIEQVCKRWKRVAIVVWRSRERISNIFSFETVRKFSKSKKKPIFAWHQEFCHYLTPIVERIMANLRSITISNFVLVISSDIARIQRISTGLREIRFNFVVLTLAALKQLGSLENLEILEFSHVLVKSVRETRCPYSYGNILKFFAPNWDENEDDNLAFRTPDFDQINDILFACISNLLHLKEITVEDRFNCENLRAENLTFIVSLFEDVIKITAK